MGAKSAASEAALAVTERGYGRPHNNSHSARRPLSWVRALRAMQAIKLVVVGGAPFVRFKGSFGPLAGAETLASGSATVEGVATPLTVSGKTWRLDAPIMPLGSIIAQKTLVPVSLTTSAGAAISGKLTIELEMRAIDITTGDAYETWPAPKCEPDVLACLQTPANAVDASACGDAFHVLPCWKTAHP